MKRIFFLFILVLLTSSFFLGAVPEVAHQMNGVAARWVKERKFERANIVYKYLSLFGNLDAINNRAVLLKNGYGVERDDKKAKAMLEAVAAQGHLAARYNLATMMPNRSRTPAPVIRRTIALLEPNVVRGDTHSAILYASRLRYKNRTSIVENRLGKRRALLKIASRTNDKEYIINYARELIYQAKYYTDRKLLFEAVDILQIADRLGVSEAAHELGKLRTSARGSLQKKGLPAYLASKSAFDWYRRSIADGNIGATCSLGLNLYYSAARLLNPLAPTYLESGQRSDRRYLNGQYQMREAIANMQKCVAHPTKRDKSVRVSGRHALRLGRKLKSDKIDRSTRGFANYYLGIVYANGLGVPRDVSRAKRYIKRAAKRYNIKPAKKILETLPENSNSATSYVGLYRPDTHWYVCMAAEDVKTCGWYGHSRYVTRAHRGLKATWW